MPVLYDIAWGEADWQRGVTRGSNLFGVRTFFCQLFNIFLSMTFTIDSRGDEERSDDEVKMLEKIAQPNGDVHQPFSLSDSTRRLGARCSEAQSW